jgi:hypothetical protein
MRKMVITLLALSVFAASTAFAGSQAIRFSKVYGGGGSATGTYCPDFVELVNYGPVPVDMSNWQIQYGSAAGNFASNTFTIATLPAGAIIPACGYYLVQVGTVAVPGTCVALPVTPDFINLAGPNMSGTAGKVALLPAGTGTNLLCAAIQPLAIDLFGWGTANCFETQAAPTPSNALVAVRNNIAIDTDNNFADFANVSAPTVVLHNAASGYADPACYQAVPATRNSWGQIKTMYR